MQTIPFCVKSFILNNGHTHLHVIFLMETPEQFKQNDKRSIYL